MCTDKEERGEEQEARYLAAQLPARKETRKGRETEPPMTPMKRRDHTDEEGRVIGNL